jgi:sugar phosphate isomerase/epimerase
VKLGLVTYNLARDWPVETIIACCQETGLTGVELRTGHAHGVEIELTPAQRRQVRQRFADSPVALVGLGSAFEYDAVDPAEVARQVQGTCAYIELARDLGVAGVKVRPNRLHEDQGVPRDRTLAQIGQALRQCARFGQEHGVEVRLEVHGHQTCEPAHIGAILDEAGHDNLKICWNSNAQDVVDGSLASSFALLGARIGLVHINELWSDYPWRELFHRLRGRGYAGYCLAEVPESPDPVRFLRYYRALFEALAASEGEGR